jgi:hypothetical protein
MKGVGKSIGSAASRKAKQMSVAAAAAGHVVTDNVAAAGHVVTDNVAAAGHVVTDNVAAAAHMLDSDGSGHVDLSDLISKDPLSDIDPLNEASVRNAIREIILLLIFLVLYTTLTMRNVFDHNIFDYGHAVRSMFIDDELLPEHAPWGQNFNDIENVDEYKYWLMGPFAEAAFGHDGQHRYIKFVGSIRFSQLRSKKTVCEDISDEVREENETYYCYGKGRPDIFSLAHEDTADFGNFSTFGKFKYNGMNGVTGVANTEDTVTIDRGYGIFSSYMSAEMVVYPAPGFAITVHPGVGAERGREIMNEIFEGGYVDLQTKISMVELTFYHSMLDRLCTLRTIVEMDDGGMVTSSSEIKILRLWDNHTDEDRNYFILAVVIFGFYIYYTLQELLEMHFFGWSYWHDGLNVIQIINVIVYFTYNLLHATMGYYTPRNIEPSSDTFYNFQPAGRAMAVATTLMAMTVVLNWFKAIPILSLSKTFMVMAKTIEKAAAHVSGFLVVFCMIMFGFTHAHVIMYGERLKNFQSLPSAFFALLKALLGDFEFDQLRQANPYAGPLFFIIFIVLSVFVVLNMLIAIISEAYQEAKEEAESRSHLDLPKMIREYFYSLLIKIPVVGWVAKKTVAEAKKTHSLRGVTSKAIESVRMMRKLSIIRRVLPIGEKCHQEMKKPMFENGDRVKIMKTDHEYTGKEAVVVNRFYHARGELGDELWNGDVLVKIVDRVGDMTGRRKKNVHCPQDELTAVIQKPSSTLRYVQYSVWVQCVGTVQCMDTVCEYSM